MFYRQFGLLFQDIVVIGAGGTGSRIIQPLIQTIKQAQAQINPCLYIVDGDDVEFKNLSRQNFIDRDIGRNKAIVMAERYGAALDFPVVAHPEFIKPGGSMFNEIGCSAREQDLRQPSGMRKLIIMCVDSIDARLMILDQCNPDDVIIDAGNEDTFGQVSIFDKISMPHMQDHHTQQLALKPFSGEFALPFIPAPVTQYLEALVNPPEATGSCADLDQSLAVNNLMAAGIINFVQNLAYNNKFYCRTNYFDLIKGNTSERMTHTWFNQVFNETTEYKNDKISLWSHASAMKLNVGMYHKDIVNKVTRDISKTVKFIDPALLAALGK